MTGAKATSQSDPSRLLPIVTRAFAELGYRRATTAELARRCGVRENILYRAWASKKAMFLAAIEYVFDSSRRLWERLLADGDPKDAAQRVLDYESVHHGEFGLYRVVFAGLSETDDPDIRSALRHMYHQFHGFIAAQVGGAQAKLIGWALVGVGTVSNIARELDLLSAGDRRAMFRQVGRMLLNDEHKG